MNNSICDCDKVGILIFLFAFSDNKHVYSDIEVTLSSLRDQEYTNFNVHIYGNNIIKKINKIKYINKYGKRFIFHDIKSTHKLTFRELITSILLNYNFSFNYISILFAGDRIKANYYNDMVVFLKNNNNYVACHPSSDVILENDNINNRILKVIFCKDYGNLMHGIVNSQVILHNKFTHEYEMVLLLVLSGNIKCLDDIKYQNKESFTINKLQIDNIFSYNIDKIDELQEDIVSKIFYINRLFNILNLEQHIIDKENLINLILNISLSHYGNQIYTEIYNLKYFFDNLKNENKNNYTNLYNKYVFMKKYMALFRGQIKSLCTDLIEPKTVLDLQSKAWFKMSRIKWNNSVNDRKFIVTMTSYGKRIKTIAHKSLWSIMQQSIPPDGIITLRRVSRPLGRPLKRSFF